jgi:hypothetical protein
VNTRIDGLAATAAFACVVILAGCATPEGGVNPAARLSVPEACSSLEGAMDQAGLPWPVANNPVTRESADRLLDGFEEVAARTDGDLRTTLDAWTSGFKFYAPYLAANDPQGAAAAANDVQEESLLLANTNLATFCHW